MRDQLQFTQKNRFNNRWYACAKRNGIWLYQRVEHVYSAPSVDPTQWWHNLLAADAAFDALMQQTARTQNMPAMLERHRAMMVVEVGSDVDQDADMDADADETLPMWKVAS